MAIEDGSLRLPEAEAPIAPAAPVERSAPSWRREWRARVVKCLAKFQQLLAGYTLFYVDDYEGQKRPFGSPVAALAELGWVCNVFAVPLTAGSSERWQAALRRALSGL